MDKVVTTSTRAAVVLLLLSVLAAQAQRKQAAPVAPPSTPGASTPEVTTTPVPWSPEASKFTLEMIGNSHVDSVWLWPFAEADAVVHSTFRSALDRLREDPKLTMTTSSSQFYEWIEGSDPGMLDEIRQRVRQGRWDPVGLVGRARREYPLWRITHPAGPVRTEDLAEAVRASSRHRL